jgi:predicted nucleic acid-binding protein
LRKSNNDVEVETLRKIVEEMLVKKAEQKELTDFKNKVSKALSEKIKLQEVEEIIKSFQSELTST